MRRYETITILRPGLAEDEINAILDRSQAIITDAGGKTVKVDRWGLKRLAYDIKKENQGFYTLMEYAGTPDAVAEMERLYRIDDKVLKYMTVKLQDHYTEDPQPEGAEETAEEGK